MNYFKYLFRILIPKAAPFKVFIVRIIDLINLVDSHSISQYVIRQVPQSVGRSASQSVSQLISQSVSKSVCLLVCKSLHVAINPSDFSHFHIPRCVEFVASGNKNLLTLFCPVTDYLEV